MSDVRENLNIVVAGHVDHGKSTLIGRLLYDTNSLSEGAINKVKKISEEKGKKFEYAYLLDAFEEEQKQGITIDITMLQFFTKKRDYVIIDAPGHKEFLKNMISGAASAEVAILVVDANEGIQEQSKRHGYMISLLGIKKVYVAVNKMDLVNYSEQRFEEIRGQFNRFLGELGIEPEGYIPISALDGDNIANKSNNMKWYKGNTILETMDSVEKDDDIVNKPLRLAIQDVYKFDNRRIVAGKIESGSLKAGDEIVIYPEGKKTRIKSLEFWQEKDKVDILNAGMSVGITLEDEFFNKRGEIITHIDDGATVSNKINANIFWLGASPLVPDKKYKLKLGTQEVSVYVDKINKVIDASDLREKFNVKEINKNDVAEVLLKTSENVAFDEFNKIQATGRFVIVDGYDVCGGGIIGDSKANIKTIEKVINRNSEVSKDEREKLLGQKGKVIWLTGLPGCGKSEIAVRLEKQLFKEGKAVYCINAEKLNESEEYDYNLDENQSLKVTDNIAKIAKALSDTGVITVVSSVSRYKKDRLNAKEIIGGDNFIEVLVEADKEVRDKRAVAEVKSYKYEKADSPILYFNIDKWDFDAEERAKELYEVVNMFIS